MGRIIYLLILIYISLLVGGCAFTKMETARQLDGGEAVFSGSLDWPGVGPVPRASAGVAYGLGGGGDMSAHIGTTVFSGNAGVGGRVYLSERFNLGLQADAMTILTDFGMPEIRRREAAIISAVPRLTTAVKDGEFLYGGLQANVFNGVERVHEGGVNAEFLGVAFGAIVGVDYDFRDNPLGIQAELIIYPAGLDEGGRPTIIGQQQTIPAVAQFNVGLNYRRPPAP